MKSYEIRQAFFDYFIRQGHRHIPSSSLIPDHDPTLLFTNAGMNQFKNLFLGLETQDYSRAVTSQKCVRAGGKHNDLESVGHTARHHTFFEMLGNFSFGDYFKKDAIHFAWDFITKTLGLPKERLYVSVFTDDQEAADLWHKQELLSKDRIFKFGEKDNFWRMGESGPCGPCSEIFYDLGSDVEGNPQDNVMGGSGDRFMEIWNLVFMQYHEDGQGGRFPLPRPSIDTGMGLERLTTVLQSESSNYHTDIFMDLISVAEEHSGMTYLKKIKDLSPAKKIKAEETNVALRVLADHARTSAFLIGDGVLPSNEGRGYVLRRIMRRAIRYGRKLSLDQSLLLPVVKKVITKMGSVYPELIHQQNLISSTVQEEEQKFLTTLDQGTQILNEELSRLKTRGLKVVHGDLVFKLYDTFGFPVDLTQLMSQEQGLTVDQKGFDLKMHEARQKARASWKGKGLDQDKAQLILSTQALLQKNGPTQFVGYETTTVHSAQLLFLNPEGSNNSESLLKNQRGWMVFDQTPFYAEGGGQVADTGTIQGPTGHLEVLDCQKINDLYFHHVAVVDGEFHVDQSCQLFVENSKRRSTANNHSATHLLHAALRQTLGEHIRQAGSLVEPERLRFDFTHPHPLTREEIQTLETLVNQEISAARPVIHSVMSHEEALQSGALALFGEKYGAQVRVIQMGDFSMELCGGTHVSNTSLLRVFKIVSEHGVSSGVRRIEAITGDKAINFLLHVERENSLALEAAHLAENLTLAAWIEQIKAEKKQLERQLQIAKGQQIDLDQLTHQAKKFVLPEKKEGQLIFADLPLDNRQILSDTADRLKTKIKSGVIILIGQGENSHPLIVSVTKELHPELQAGKILSELATTMGGKGGGRPDFAQGAVPNRTHLLKAQAQIHKLLGIKDL